MDNATGTWYSAWLAFRSPMVGSINAPEPGFRPGVRWGVVPRWCPPIGRRIGSPSLRHLHYPAVAPGPAVSYQSFGAASVLGGSTPSRGPRGAGAHGYPGTSDRRLFGAWPNCRPCAECSPPKFIGGLSLTVMDGGRTLRHPSAAAWAACRRPLRSFSFPFTISACRRRA